MARRAGDEAVAFAEKVLALLDQGQFTATYKYAVLLALMELCLEGVTRAGAAPQSVTTRQLAERVVELYWPHTLPYGERTALLRQNRGGQAEILSLIGRFRAELAGDPMAPLARARLARPAAFARLVRDVEWKLVEMPLPRLQRFGRQRDEFIYTIGWTDEIRRGHFNDEAGFDNRLLFVGDAADHLVRLAGLLGPLLRRQWAAQIARLNRDLVPDAGLEEFLFGVERAALEPLARPLRELQDGRCFYCTERLTQVQVDHFLPWARVPLDAIENLLAACPRCNARKRDFLAAAPHVERWRQRLERRHSDLEQIAQMARWEVDRSRCLGIARGLYLRLPRGARLWLRGDEFEASDGEAMRRLLAT